MEKQLDLLVGQNVLVFQSIGKSQAVLYFGGNLNKLSMGAYTINPSAFGVVNCGIRFYPDDVKDIEIIKESKVIHLK